MQLNSRKIRDQKGAAVTGLVIALMFFVLIAGLFAFDASRVQMAQRELTATCDASALAGTAMLTSYNVSNDPNYTKLLQAQQNAAAYSYNMFMMGNVLGRWLRGNTSLVSTLSALQTTTDGQANVVIGLVDPQNNFAIVPPATPGNAAGKAIGVYAGYGYHPIFISFFGVGNVGILASSVGGLPQVDAVLVMDFSGSMDDLTPIELVARVWDAHNGPNAMNTPTSDSRYYPEPVAATEGYNGANPDSNGWNDLATGNPQALENFIYGGAYVGTLAGIYRELSGHGCITYFEAPHPTSNQDLLSYIGLDTTLYLTGTSFNALPPQNLELSNVGTFLGASQQLVFKPFLRFTPGGNDYGSPPGNCPAWKKVGANYQPVNSFGWSATPLTAGSSTSPYTHVFTSAIDYPTSSGLSGQAPKTNCDAHAVIFTDLVVLFGGTWQAGSPVPTSQTLVNGQVPVQPAFGPALPGLNSQQYFTPVSYTFGGSTVEDDPTIAGNTYTFNNVAVLVEASRGNLDSLANYNATSINARGYDLRAQNVIQYFGSGATNMSPQTGYQKAYQRLAMWFTQPIATCADAADQAFFQRLSALTDCRFGLVGFSDDWALGAAPNIHSYASEHSGVAYAAGGTPTFTGCTSYYVDTAYAGIGASQEWDGRLIIYGAMNTGVENTQPQNTGGSGTGFRLPRTPLDTSVTQAQALHIIQHGDASSVYAWSDPRRGNGIYNGRPLNGTMCSEALETARLEFKNAPYNGAQRPGSKRAIIFFTDGVPSPASEAAPSLTTATNCNQDGVAIFCIGLNMTGNPSLTAQQTSFLGDPGGLSGLAKNGGKFFKCQSTNDVQLAFSAIARRLTQSQK